MPVQYPLNATQDPETSYMFNVETQISLNKCVNIYRNKFCIIVL